MRSPRSREELHIPPAGPGYLLNSCFEVLEVPGHSPGAPAFLRAGYKVLSCGDTVTNRRAKLTDLRPRPVG